MVLLLLQYLRCDWNLGILFILIAAICKTPEGCLLLVVRFIVFTASGSDRADV